MRTPFIKLPKHAELALFLIGEELKTRKFFNGLSRIGIEDSEYQCHLGSLIADCVGYDVQEDENWRRFDEIIEKYVEEFEVESESQAKLVMEVYTELVNEVKNQNGSMVES